VTPTEFPASVADEVIATIPELPRETDAGVAPAVRAGIWPDDDYAGWSGL
jgi:hypothetical protein